MIVFRHAVTPVRGERLLREVRRASAAGSRPEAELRLLLAAAALESAVSDYWGAVSDADDRPRAAARHLLLLAARAFLGNAVSHQVWEAAVHAVAVTLPPCHEALPVGYPEGFCFYGLHPNVYVDCAHRWAARHSASAGAPVVVIGLRTIGSALAAVVSAALLARGHIVRLLTLRPRGRPEDRYYAVARELEATLRHSGACFIVADEGPGLSGSSFGGAVSWLRQLGIPGARISLFPSWDPPADRLSHTVVSRDWDRWEKYPAGATSVPGMALQELSAGRWRAVFPPARPVPVWPQQERAKYLSGDGRHVLKFEGLGAFGDAAFDRARFLAQADFAPAVVREGGGWLRFERIRCRPLINAGARAAAWMGRYLAFVRSQFRVGSAAPPSPALQLMMRENFAHLTGHSPTVEAPEGVPVLLDGRMLPQEMAHGAGGLIKFDSVDHADDHFFPGPCDIAWDLAAVAIEFGPAIGAVTLQEYERRSGDHVSAQRLAWHRLAYASFRAAFADFAAELVADPDRMLFLRQFARYREAVLSESGLAPVRETAPPRVAA